MENASEGGSELGEQAFRAGAFFLADNPYDVLDREPASAAADPRGAFTEGAADLRDRLRATLADERTDVAVGDTCTMANDHGMGSLPPPTMKFNVKVGRMNRRSFLASSAVFPLFFGLSRARQDRDFDVLVRGGSVLDGSGAPAVLPSQCASALSGRSS